MLLSLFNEHQFGEENVEALCQTHLPQSVSGANNWQQFFQLNLVRYARFHQPFDPMSVTIAAIGEVMSAIARAHKLMHFLKGHLGPA